MKATTGVQNVHRLTSNSDLNLISNNKKRERSLQCAKMIKSVCKCALKGVCIKNNNVVVADSTISKQKESIFYVTVENVIYFC